MNLTMVWSIVTKVLDILIVWLSFYYILKNIKNNVKMVLIVKGIVIVLILKILSDLLDLYTVGVLLEYVVAWGPLAIIVIFQPEIRSILESLGRTQLLARHKILTGDEREKVVYELMKSVEYFKKHRIGALIVIEREISLQNYIENSTKIYADLTSDLLETIFSQNSPMQDGGVIIQGDRITSAGAIFKTSMNPAVSKKLGTRHRAGLGIAEESDAIALIVSEESGRISLACNNNLEYNLSLDDFKMRLIEELNPKSEVFYEAEQDEEGDDNA